ncbi:hypothetical protein APS_2143 [Acetobacter pasteurianus subsp. pasteurianus LMG 1262 = NBRC 106471]|nr:hypothetical protein APS_2143 [Acetobacter pasteurianus subsp. pasteurianus LMG 1262 = NBRC 106471]
MGLVVVGLALVTGFCGCSVNFLQTPVPFSLFVYSKIPLSESGNKISCQKRCFFNAVHREVEYFYISKNKYKIK